MSGVRLISLQMCQCRWQIDCGHCEAKKWGNSICYTDDDDDGDASRERGEHNGKLNGQEEEKEEEEAENSNDNVVVFPQVTKWEGKSG